MKLQMVGCSHHTAPVEVRERLAFSREQAAEALARFRSRYPAGRGGAALDVQPRRAVCRQRGADACPTHHDVVAFLAEFHGLEPVEVFNDLFERTGEDFVRHLFTVAASLDSMVVGEAQILGAGEAGL